MLGLIAEAMNPEREMENSKKMDNKGTCGKWCGKPKLASFAPTATTPRMKTEIAPQADQ
jgi:hypothetical protein